MTTKLATLMFAAAALGLAGGSASAQSRLEARVQQGVEKVRAACGEDVARYCGQVTPGEGRLLLCMQAHEDKISPKCDFALFEASRNLNRALDTVERAADACYDDASRFCASVPPGGGGILKCLASNRAQLGRACKRAVQGVEAAAR
jgi:hypothetical protein